MDQAGTKDLPAITSSIAVLILLPVLFMMLKEHELRHGTLRGSTEDEQEDAG
jgi:hypothetical protein